MIEAPIFHVNGDDPSSVVMIVELALEFRQKIQRDVVVDMYCYRKHGHNETDEPAFTQPTLYKEIKSHKSISQIMSAQLVEEKTLSVKGAAQIENKFQETLETAFKSVKLKKEISEENHESAAQFEIRPMNNPAPRGEVSEECELSIIM